MKMSSYGISDYERDLDLSTKLTGLLLPTESDYVHQDRRELLHQLTGNVADHTPDTVYVTLYTLRDTLERRMREFSGRSQLSSLQEQAGRIARHAYPLYRKEITRILNSTNFE